MKFSRILAVLLALFIILSAGAYAAEGDGADESAEPDTEAAPADESAPGGFIVLDRHNAKVVLEGVTASGKDGVLLRSICGGDVAEDGELEIRLRDVNAEGSILHGDGHSPMTVALEGSQLTGAVTVSAEEPADGEHPAPSVHMTMDGASSWTVTAESKMDSFTMEKGAMVQAPQGLYLAIYVGCDQDDAGCFDASTGSYIAAFVADVEYANVVIRVTDEEVTDAEPDMFAALGIGTAVVDGEYGVELEAFLEAMGVQVTYDEENGDIIIEDPDGVLDLLAEQTQE